MNISHDGTTVRFKTEPEELFEAEKSGAKSNTVRILNRYEYRQLVDQDPQKIIIQHHQEIFLRTITHIHVEHVFGKVIAIFSWTNEEHHHTLPNNIARDSYAHTMSIDWPEPSPPLKYQAINVSLSLLKRLDLYRIEETYDEFISKLLDDYKSPPHMHTMPQEGCSEEQNVFIPVTISEQLFHSLQSIASDKSMNMVIHDLFQIYINKLTEERGPLHD